MGMTAESRGTQQAQSGFARWRPWVHVALIALLLLLLSEAVWLWQTWPVRELLQPLAAGAARP
jgi:hypothetical protein